MTYRQRFLIEWVVLAGTILSALILDLSNAWTFAPVLLLEIFLTLMVVTLIVAAVNAFSPRFRWLGAFGTILAVWFGTLVMMSVALTPLCDYPLNDCFTWTKNWPLIYGFITFNLYFRFCFVLIVLTLAYRIFRGGKRLTPKQQRRFRRG